MRIHFRMMSGRELKDQGITAPAEIGVALGMPGAGGVASQTGFVVMG